MNAIVAEGLVKTYRSGKTEVRALDGVDLVVPEGTVLGLLGPNGAGKTTAVRILATLLRPDSGRASVAGFDVVREAQHVRGIIGLSGQYAAVDENLTGRENLVLFGRLYQLSGGEARGRADELLGQFDLADAADRVVKGYSGGMRRRLDLASALTGRPRILFLDEPTTGLDLNARETMWATLRGLVAAGTSIVLTTHYIEEAEALADRVVMMANGRRIAEGTVEEMRATVARKRIDCVTATALSTIKAWPGVTMASIEDGRTSITTTDAEATVRLLLADVTLADLEVRRGALSDAFAELTQEPAQ